MKVDCVRARAAGACAACCAGIVACLTTLAVFGAGASTGWMVAIGILVAFPVGIYAGLRRVAQIYSAPPAPDDAVARRRGFARGVAEVSGIPAIVVVGGVLGRLSTLEPLMPEVETAAGLLPLLAGLLALQLTVWRAAADVERRWPIRLVEGSSAGGFQPTSVYAVHLEPRPAESHIEAPAPGNLA